MPPAALCRVFVGPLHLLKASVDQFTSPPSAAAAAGPCPAAEKQKQQLICSPTTAARADAVDGRPRRAAFTRKLLMGTPCDPSETVSQLNCFLLPASLLAASLGVVLWDCLRSCLHARRYAPTVPNVCNSVNWAAFSHQQQQHSHQLQSLRHSRVSRGSTPVQPGLSLEQPESHQ